MIVGAAVEGWMFLFICFSCFVLFFLLLFLGEIHGDPDDLMSPV